MLKPSLISLTFLALTFLGAACSASGNSNIPNDDGGADDGASHDGSTKSDGGSDGSAGDGQTDGSNGTDASTGTHFRGQLVDFQSAAAIVGGSVSGAGKTATSDASGFFDLAVLPNAPFTATGTAALYTKLIGQELMISGDDDFGFLPMIKTGTTSLLRSQFPGYSPTMGALIVLAVPTGTCASEGGTTLSVSPGGTVVYFSGGFPSASATSITAGQAPSAVIYNITPGVALTLSASSPTCSQKPYPVTQGVLTYTGAMQVEPGDAITAARVFLQ